jgi:hypothetical protein
MRHLGITLEHTSADNISVVQSMYKHGDKLVQDSEPHERLELTYDQAYDLKDQLIDFLGNYEPGE